MPRSTWVHCASGARVFSPSTSAAKLSCVLIKNCMTITTTCHGDNVFSLIFRSGGLELLKSRCFMSCNLFRSSARIRNSCLVHFSNFLRRSYCYFYVSDSRKKSSGVTGQRSHATAASTEVGFHLNPSQSRQLRSVQTGLRAYRFGEIVSFGM